MVLVAIFFITGADSASIVMGSLSSNGSLEHPKPRVVIFWGALTGAVAAVMLLAGGDEPSRSAWPACNGSPSWPRCRSSS